MLAGVVNHRDSLGNAGSITAGDVQWMTAGRGIMHEEMPRPYQGKMAGFQLWVNLPAKLKMIAPRYQEIASAQIPEATTEDGARIRVIAGTMNGISGPVSEIAADPIYLDVSVPTGGSFVQAVERGHTAFAYVFAGGGRFGVTNKEDGEAVGHPTLVVFGDGDRVGVRAVAQSVRFLFVSGKPLYEPIARYGPFVMNTAEEIEQALRDLRNGTFV
jgi:redox-sensitive bicupin YhaK (pirin superfamily)